MDDATAYMALALNNAQGELSAIERGLHALNSDMGVREYARAVNRGADQVSRERHAAEVLAHANTLEPEQARNLSRHLAEIHAAPRWLWPALVAAMVAGELLKDLEKAVGGRPSEKTGSSARPVSTTLKDIGVSKQQSSNWQHLAAVPRKTSPTPRAVDCGNEEKARESK